MSKTKEQLQANLQRIETELEEIKQELAKVEGPERGPEAWDVYKIGNGGYLNLCLPDDGVLSISPNDRELHVLHKLKMSDEAKRSYATYLGKFHDVFVRKDKVIEALSIEDIYGNSVLSGLDAVYGGVIVPTRHALAKLGITAKED
jgi:hypothetical protein